MRLLYLSTWDFSNEEYDGVCSKIRSQIKVFENKGFDVDFIFIKDGKLFYRQNGEQRVLASIGSIRKTMAYMKMYPFLKHQKYDFVYNRYGMADTFYNRVIRRLRKNGAKIFVEIPTYPYDGEKLRGILYRCMFLWDKVSRRCLKRYVSKITSYTEDEYDKIWGIDVIGIRNGIDVSNIVPVCNNVRNSDEIHLLIVASMMKHHGYERLLEGLYKYYQADQEKLILCKFVGDGAERENYEKIVKEYRLQSYVEFCGMKNAEELNAYYEWADFGITALGLFRQNINLSSELKSREYLSKGIPIISGCQIDVFSDHREWFYLQFPADDSPIDINRIIELYDQICQKGTKLENAKIIREFAQKTVDITVTMEPILEAMKE